MEDRLTPQGYDYPNKVTNPMWDIIDIDDDDNDEEEE